MFRSASNGVDGVVFGSAQGLVATPPDAVGKIQTTIGPVTVMRAGGVVARVDVGEFVYQGDAIATGADGAVGIIFADGTVFNLSSDARAVLNKFAYDPNGTSNSALLSLAQGKFAFIAGKAAKTGGLRIDTPFASIRGSARDRGVGVLTLAALTFAAIEESQAASRHDAFLDDGTITYKDLPHGTFEIVTRDGRVIMSDDPGETIVVDPTGAVTRIPNSSSRMAELQQAQHSALATFSLGQEGGAAGGSSSPGFDIPVQLQPINFSQPRNDARTEIVTNNITPLNSGFIEIFQPRTPPPPPPPPPTISLTAIAITNPNSATSIVNASAAHAGFPIIGITSEVEDGRTITITIVNSANQVVYTGTTTVTNGSWLLEISSAAAKLIPDGNYTVIADVTNASGNTGHASKTVLIDTVAAALSPPDLIAASDSGSSSADKITNVTTPTATGGGAEADATVTLYDTNGTVLGTAVADGSGNWSITSSPLCDGVHQLTATQFDLAGNASAISAALSITVDTVAAAPSAPDLMAASDSFGPTGTNTDNISNDTTPTVSGNGAEAGATVTLYDTNGTTVLGTAVADASGNWTITSSPLFDGVHSLTATQTDIAGNTSVVSAALSVTVDTVAAAPSAPDLIAASDSGTSNTDNVTSDNTPTVTGSGSEAGATVTLFDTNGTTVLGTAVADALGNWTITSSLLSDGDHSLTVKQTDIAGNTSVASTALPVHIDTTSGAPSAPDLVAASDSFGPTGTNADNITNDSTPTVTGSGAEAGATVTLFDTNGTTVLGTAVADALGNWTITSSLLSDGVHSLTVKQTDIEGNTSVASAGLSVRIDTVAAAPSAPDLVAASDSFGPTGTNTDNISNDTTPTVSGNGAEAGATVTLFDTNGTTVLGTAVADASGNWTITSSPLFDGVHSLTATQTDIAGNTSVVSAALSVTVDTVAAAPSAPDLIAASDSGTSNTDNVTSDNTPTVTGSGAEAGATVTLFDTNGTTVLGTAVADALGNWTITSSLLSDGDHSLTVKQTDIAGNTSVASTALPVHIDTTSGAPSAPDLVAASDSFGPTGTNTDNITNDSTPTVTGSGAEAGATVTLFDTNGTTVLGTAVADALGNWTITSSLLSDGVHSLTVKQTDIEGNTSVASAGLSVRIDTVAAAPSAPDLVAASDSFGPTGTNTDNISNDTTPTVSGNGAEAGATVTLFDTNGTTVLGTAVADASGNWTITSSPLFDGVHSLTATQTDIAGNTSVVSAALSVTVDTVAAAPSAPDLIAASDSGTSNTDNVTSDNTPTVTGSGAEAGATVTLFDTNGTTVLGTAVADALGNWTITSSLLSDGDHSLTVKQTDIAGNTSVASTALPVHIDTTSGAPSAPDLVAASDSFGPTGTNADNITNDSTPTVTGSGAEAGATVTLFDTNGTTVLGTAVADALGNWTITSSLLSDGVHSLTVKQTDIEGNTSVASAGLSVRIDTVAAAPSAPDLVAASDSGTSNTDNISNDTTPTVSGNGAEAGATVTLYDTNGTTVLGTAVADASGNWTITSSPLFDGVHSLTVKQTDIAGNTSVVSAALSVTVDTTAPTIAINTIAGDDIVNGSEANAGFAISGTESGADGQAVTVKIVDSNGNVVDSYTTLAAGGAWSVSVTPAQGLALADGSYTVTADVSDAAGNSATEATRVITVPLTIALGEVLVLQGDTLTDP